jgi:hypothetical protein
MPGRDRGGVLAGQVDHRLVGARPAHEPFARCLAEGDAEADAGYRADECLVQILDGLDEM